MDSRARRVALGSLLLLVGLFLVAGGTIGTTADSPIAGTWLHVNIVVLGVLFGAGGATVTAIAFLRRRKVSGSAS